MDAECHYRVSVKGIVVDSDGRFLLAKEDNNTWELLGGGLDHGEDPKTCLIREIYEETGLKVIWISDEPKYFVTAPKVRNPGFVANVVYEIKLDSLGFTPSEECQELRFFSPQEARREKLYPQIEALAKVFDAKKHRNN